MFYLTSFIAVDGWHQCGQSEYLLRGGTDYTFDQAQEECAMVGGTLAKMTNQYSSQFISQRFSQFPTGKIGQLPCYLSLGLMPGYGKAFGRNRFLQLFSLITTRQSNSLNHHSFYRLLCPNESIQCEKPLNPTDLK